MGYNTDFTGELHVHDKDGKRTKLDGDTAKLIIGLSRTRRMMRDTEKLAKRLGISVEECEKLYGEEGELYIHEDGEFGQTSTDDIVDFNYPPKNQPGLWCNWTYDSDNNVIVWNESEKTYDSPEWIDYIGNLLSKRGYLLNGIISWQGEDSDDEGKIRVDDSKVLIDLRKVKYTLAEINKMKVKDLRDALVNLGEDTKGLKSVLKERLIKICC